MEQFVDWERVIQSISDLVMILDLDQRIIAVNSATEKATGKTEKELVGHYCFEVFHCSPYPPAVCPHQKILKSMSPKTEDMVMEALNGQYLVTETPIFDHQGHIVRTVCIAKDITERKTIEKNYKESSEILDKIFLVPHFMVVLLDNNFNFIRVNRAYAETSNHAPDFFVGKNHFALYPHQENEAIFRQVVATGEPFTVFAKPFEYPEQPERGITYWDWSLYPIKDASGDVDGLLFTLIEVTERKRSEVIRQAEEGKYRRLVENIGSEYFLYSHDTGGVLTYVSPSITDILGYSQQEFLTSFDQYMTDNPKNKPDVRHTELSSIKEIKQRHYEVEIYHRNGSVHTLEVIEEPVFDNKGKVVSVEGIAHDVSEQRRVAAELLAKEMQWANAMDFIDDAIYLVDLDDKVKVANKAFCRLVGLTPEQVIGHDIAQIIHPQGEAVPCSVCLARQERRDAVIAMDTDNPSNPSGHPIQVMVNIIRDQEGAPNSVLMGIRDMSPWAEIQKQGQIFNQIHEAVITTDTHGTITSWNAGAEKLTGFMADEQLGSPIARLFEKGELPVANTSAPEMESLLKSNSGVDIPVLISASRLQSVLGETSGKIYCLMDLTENKKVEEKFRQSQKMESIGTLAGGIAHDFNNILNAIIGYTDLAMMRDKDQTVGLHDDLRQVRLAGERATDLVRQILTFSRKKQKEKTPIQISLVIKEALKLLRASLPSTIEIRQEINSQGVILADSTEMHQLIMNLCTNAFHAMMDRGGVLDVSLKEMVIAHQIFDSDTELPPGNYVVLSVRDTGCGMDKDTMLKIFDPYFTTKTPERGTGLGLAVVHGIVKGHHGKITVSSELGHGAIFTVYLPLIVEDETLTVIEEVPPRSRKHERVMVVDDESAIRDLNSYFLDQAGYRVESFANGFEAWNAFALSPGEWDLLITDQTMPEMTGEQLIAKVQAIRPDLPIILCSGYSPITGSTQIPKTKLTTFLEKPVTRNKLLSQVAKALMEKS
ncbi:MAG: PAS domain S-box protein [Proteobacteria bacterium]|nr:PAS domain S-box protein [Pseudomonadota bacterium]